MRIKKILLLIGIVPFCFSCIGEQLDPLIPDIIVGEHQGVPIVKIKSCDFLPNSLYTSTGDVTRAARLFTPASPPEIPPPLPFYLLGERTLRTQYIEQDLHFKLFPSYLNHEFVETEGFLFGLGLGIVEYGDNGLVERSIKKLVIMNEFGKEGYEEAYGSFYGNVFQLDVYFDVYISYNLLSWVGSVPISYGPGWRSTYFVLYCEAVASGETKILATVSIAHKLEGNQIHFQYLGV